MRRPIEAERGRRTGVVLACLLPLLVAGCAAPSPPSLTAQTHAEAKLRGFEVIILSKGRTHYFENRLPHCLAYILSGEWEFAAQEAALRTADRRRFVGVLLLAAETMPGPPGADAVSRAVAYYRADAEKDWGSISSTVQPFPLSRAGTVVLEFGDVVVTAEAAARTLGPHRLSVGQTAQLPKRVIAPFSPGLVMVVTVTEVADAREVLDTLEVTEHPQCWRQTIRQRFPGIRPSTASSESDSGRESLGRLMTYFYRQPDRSRVGAFIKSLSEHRILEDPMAVPPIQGFLAVLFQRYPSDLAEWSTAIAALPRGHQTPLWTAVWLANTAEARKALGRASESGLVGAERETLEKTPPSLPGLEVATASDLDLLWGAFFASGDTAYVARIITVLDWDLTRVEASRRLERLAVLEAAKWGLASNSQQHELVLSFCQEQLLVAAEPRASRLREVVRKATTIRKVSGRARAPATILAPSKPHPIFLGTSRTNPMMVTQGGRDDGQAKEAGTSSA